MIQFNEGFDYGIIRFNINWNLECNGTRNYDHILLQWRDIYL